ncbi:MAG: hypothetical protein OXE51_04750 [Gammaproteobacteria bacterium]|nr:hypothetical protein [Gammaproteobacteria bacterium]
MRKLSGIIAVIGLGLGLAWAAGQAGRWLGFQPQDDSAAEAESPGEGALPGTESSPGSGGIDPAGNNAPPSSDAAAPDSEAAGEDASDPQPELSAEVASIEEDLARIEEALGNEEVLEEFTPSEPLSADNPVVWPTDI